MITSSLLKDIATFIHPIHAILQPRDELMVVVDGGDDKVGVGIAFLFRNTAIMTYIFPRPAFSDML